MQKTSEHEWAIGQRWLSETEPELGLGIVTDCDHRTVTLEFRSSGETRRYARQSAPLNRILFSEGNEIKNRAGEELTVVGIHMNKGLAIYAVRTIGGETGVMPESAVSDHLTLNRPVDRLLSGQTDSYTWFRLKQRTLEMLGQVEQSRVLGLCSARTELIPHQLYIAAEVAQRYAPRVMLADEVGLGKTIEAGLILQQQLASGLASRVLIIVPEPLLHQWLVEMLRRFSLRFSLLDEERCLAIAEAGGDNPFLDEQLILTSMDLLSAQPDLFAQACAGEWDLCIVDEAHHLQDEPDGSGETDYERMQALAAGSNGMLLLTATPEQLGDESHFALLRLLDPHRFSNYAAFRKEQEHYRSLASEINAMLADPAQQKEVQRLLDEHGTGRILFRNTRRSLTGFPQRKLNAWPLAGQPDSGSLPAANSTLNAESELSREENAAANEENAAESDVIDWTAQDPRVGWLVSFLKQQKKDKVLLICAEDRTAIQLERYLRVKAGVRSSVFHRHMNIIERDRAAAYFASSDAGARIMVCSEIGSEGRNFQFCRHLVLFDLPLNPDLLEQRIGRLDRIGQKHTIQIHVPYLQNSGQEILFRWYEEGLNAFTQVAPAAWRIYREHEESLLHFLQQAQAGVWSEALEKQFVAFLQLVAARRQALQVELEKGRDRLLEINSYNAEVAGEIIADIRRFEANASPQALLCDIFDSYGIHYEENSNDTWTLYPDEEMLLPSYPELPDEGFEASFNRQTALHRDDVQFLHWQHPLVVASLDLVMDTHLGRAAVSQFRRSHPALENHHLVVETLYRIVVPAPRHLQLPRYYPATSLHLVVGGTHSAANAASAASPKLLQIEGDDLSAAARFLDKHEAFRLVKEHQREVQALLRHSEQLAQKAMAKSVNIAAQAMLEAQTAEIRRLVALKARNPNVRDSELEYLKQQTLQLHESFKQASLELVAVHVMFGQVSLLGSLEDDEQE